ncbi:unnamed protein product [Cuscuta epithymum]|uniref:Protein kinase domain-containing protein n=1 Tax=Cuscuta epithymum TaxID=186058 RepID=A0AAV0FSE0_9ASTE|nr:unnamed protein product [Cuscuta epithymum]
MPLLIFLLFFLSSANHKHYAEGQPNTTGFECNPNQSYPCQAYAFYRAAAPPSFLGDLAAIGDLFSVSRRMIAEASNISSPNAALQPNQPLFVPIACSCNQINSTFGSISYAPLEYTIVDGDTFYRVSTTSFQNLTSFQSVEAVNPTFDPTTLNAGDRITFPIFCKCPNSTDSNSRRKILITYPFQPTDTVAAIAARFGVTRQSIIDVNGNNIGPNTTVFVPVSRLPNISQPVNSSSAPPAAGGAPQTGRGKDRKGTVMALGVLLGVSVGLLVLVVGFWVRRETSRRNEYGDAGTKQMEGVMQKKKKKKEGSAAVKEMEVGLLMADVSDCLDSYRVYMMDQIREATEGFDERCLIEGSVYRGSIDGEMVAIKKLKWNACDELKILQKVNHGSLVKLKGFCIDSKEANCYLVYEYVENGSLYSWIHGDKNARLSWKTRLSIATDVAIGLQYIHEHTRPRVVHKDIKTSNILLDANMRAKIANFGLAKSGCTAITMHIMGTQGYISPEYLADGVVSTKMDVFSFGVVLLELVSGREAIDEEGRVLWVKAVDVLKGNEEAKVEKVKEWMDPSLASESFSMESVINVMSVAVACLNRDPSKRPSMVDIVYVLCKSNDLFFDVSRGGISPGQVTAR